MKSSTFLPLLAADQLGEIAFMLCNVWRPEDGDGNFLRRAGLD